jgi:hypothetical protein
LKRKSYVTPAFGHAADGGFFQGKSYFRFLAGRKIAATVKKGRNKNQPLNAFAIHCEAMT